MVFYLCNTSNSCSPPPCPPPSLAHSLPSPPSLSLPLSLSPLSLFLCHTSLSPDISDNDLFLEPDSQTLLSSLLEAYAPSLSRLDFSQPIAGLHSFVDLYSALLEQFEAGSFGNAVFSQYVLLPMLRRQPSELRRTVWAEHQLTLRSIFLSPDQVRHSIQHS